MMIDGFEPALIALDMDGTLLGTQGVLSARSKRVIHALAKQHVLVVLCTGRPPRYINKIATELNLTDTVIAYNGAIVMNMTTEQIIYKQTLPEALAKTVITNVRNSFPDVWVGLETADGWFLDSALYERRKQALQTNNLPMPNGVGDALEFVNDGVLKVFFRHASLDAARLLPAVAGLPVYATWSNAGLLEVLAAGVNKRSALAFLCDERGVAREHVAAFGDQNNDCEMLAWAGCGVAMANASADAKAAAGFETLSNDEDGVALVLEQWLRRKD